MRRVDELKQVTYFMQEENKALTVQMDNIKVESERRELCEAVQTDEEQGKDGPQSVSPRI